MVSLKGLQLLNNNSSATTSTSLTSIISTPAVSLPTTTTTTSTSITPTPPTLTTAPSSAPTTFAPTITSTSFEAPKSTSTVVVKPSTNSPDGSTIVIIKTSTNPEAKPTPVGTSPTPTKNSAAAASSSSSEAASLANNNNGTTGSGLKQGPKIAIAVIIPIVVVALLVLAGLFFWKKRKQNKTAKEELRRKEMEEYGLNPNNDPSLAVVGGASVGDDEASTMRERDAGYRGWGTTSTKNKGSTALSSNPGMERSDSGGNGYNNQHSPTGTTDVQSGDPLNGVSKDDVGALGSAPLASGNRGVHRGPSNASSAYSGGNRSDVSATSGEGPLPSGSPPYAHDYMYPGDDAAGGYGDGQPVIKDVSARRNTRIETPAVIPQQGNAGIAQNF